MMINHGEDTFIMGSTSMSTLPYSEDFTFAIKRTSMAPVTDTEDPFIMGRTLLVLAVVELVIGLGVYRYFS